MKFIIDRSKWLRGEGNSESYLLRHADSKMCCIGQCALQDGATPEQIRGLKGIGASGFRAKCPTLIDPTSGDPLSPATWVLECYSINDQFTTSDPEREAKLTAIAASAGHEFVFVDSMEAVNA